MERQTDRQIDRGREGGKDKEAKIMRVLIVHSHYYH